MSRGLKTVGSGRKAGTPNKKTVGFRARLAEHGCNLDRSLALAINDKDVELIKAIGSILGYFSPRFKDVEAVRIAPEGATESDEEIEFLLKAVCEESA